MTIANLVLGFGADGRGERDSGRGESVDMHESIVASGAGGR
jgi:hypothetical protein